jgi:[ribosomal protein S5]-alanine N-acetyltransferase
MQRIIETARLLLRIPQDDDAAAITALINDFEVSKNLARVPYPYALSDAEEFLGWAKDLNDKSRFSAITLKLQPSILNGMISYEWNSEKQNAELGYWLAKPLWRQGLMSEAAQAMVNHAFQVAGVDSIVSCYFIENPASGKVLARAGLVEVGHCTQFSKAQGKEVPVVNMQLTRTRWDGIHAVPTQSH